MLTRYLSGLVIIMAIIMLSACGQKGDLYRVQIPLSLSELG